MTFTPQGPSFGPPNQPAAGGGTKNLGFILLIAVAALGLINFLLGFAPFTSISGSSSGIGSGLDTSSSFFESSIYGLGFVFAGGVVAGVSLLPKQSYAGIAAALTLTGFFALVFAAFSVGTSDYVDISLGWGLIIVLILSFVQTVVAVAALLFEIGILKAPAPRPIAQQYGQQQPYGQAPGQAPGQPQGYGQAQYGQPQQAQQPGQYQQNPQYGQAQQQGYGGAHAAPVDPDRFAAALRPDCVSLRAEPGAKSRTDRLVGRDDVVLPSADLSARWPAEPELLVGSVHRSTRLRPAVQPAADWLDRAADGLRAAHFRSADAVCGT